MSWEIRNGDALTELRKMPEASVQCCVTSPPYFGLRDYGHAGQIGMEELPAEYVAKLVDVFGEVRRVLRDDGTLWINLGDSYANDSKWGGATGGKHASGLHGDAGIGRQKRTTGLKPKDLIGIPWRVAFALQADGWFLRSDIIWAKPNPMPESVTDRPTKSHEYIFLLAKSERYYFDQDATREPHADVSIARAKRNRFGGKYADGDPNEHSALKSGNGYGPDADNDVVCSPGGRNIRTVWNVATTPFPGAHFATFPPKLIEPCIKAGTSEKGCCENCGTPIVLINDREPVGDRGKVVETYEKEGVKNRRIHPGPHHRREDGERKWVDGCGCDSGAVVPNVVLDPFAGAGTTGLVATRLGRSFIGIELNPQYATMARNRITDDAPLFNPQLEARATA